MLSCYIMLYSDSKCFQSAVSEIVINLYSSSFSLFVLFYIESLSLKFRNLAAFGQFLPLLGSSFLKQWALSVVMPLASSPRPLADQFYWIYSSIPIKMIFVDPVIVQLSTKSRALTNRWSGDKASRRAERSRGYASACSDQK